MSEDAGARVDRLEHDAQGKALYVRQWNGRCETHAVNVADGGTCPHCLIAQYDAALKHDQSKPRTDLLPSKPLLAVSEVLGFGANMKDAALDLPDPDLPDPDLLDNEPEQQEVTGR